MGTTRWRRTKQEEEQRRCESEGGQADVWMRMSDKKKMRRRQSMEGMWEKEAERARRAESHEDSGEKKEGCRVQRVHQWRELRWEISL